MTDLLTGELGDDVPILARPAWHAQAACRGAGRFVQACAFSSNPEYQSEFIARFCYVCPVEAQCLDWGLRREREGIWGAMTPVELNRVRGERGIELETIEPTEKGPTGGKQGCGTRAGYLRHCKAGTTVCDPCRLANNDWVAAQRARAPRDRKGEVQRRREREQRAFQEGP